MVGECVERQVLLNSVTLIIFKIRCELLIPNVSYERVVIVFPLY
jgi:hypothetical protein